MDSRGYKTQVLELGQLLGEPVNNAFFLHFTLTKQPKFSNLVHHADVVELVDTLDSGSSACEGMKVQVLSSALKTR